jgi:dTDP-L-rhamnose 4-epimerase
LKIIPTDEESELAPISIYGFTKLAQEQIIQLVGKALDVPYTILRYQNVFGPGQSLVNPYTGILSIFSTQIKNGNDIEIYEDGEESRDFVYISDVIDATISCIDNPMSNNEILNVGSGVALSVLDVAEALKQLYNSKINIIISGNYRIGDIRHNLADLTKIESLLNFKPQVDFFEGIKRFAEWVNSQSISKDIYADTISELKKSNLFRKTKGI